MDGKDRIGRDRTPLHSSSLHVGNLREAAYLSNIGTYDAVIVYIVERCPCIHTPVMYVRTYITFNNVPPGEQFGSALEEGGGSDEDTDGEGNGESSARVKGVRDANNELKGSEVGEAGHDLSNIFSAYIYDILVGIFEHERDPSTIDCAECLYWCSRTVRRMLLLALFNSSATPDFTEISLAMEKAVDVVTADEPWDAPVYKGRRGGEGKGREEGREGREGREGKWNGLSACVHVYVWNIHVCISTYPSQVSLPRQGKLANLPLRANLRLVQMIC